MISPEMMQQLQKQHEADAAATSFEPEPSERCGKADPVIEGVVCTKSRHKGESHADYSDWGAVFTWVDVPVLLTPDLGSL